MTNPKSKSDSKQQRQRTDDPVLRMLGIGQQLWKGESGDRFVERLRSGDERDKNKSQSLGLCPSVRKQRSL